MHDHLKTVVITGGTRGIGFAIATTFIKAGYRVIALSRTRSVQFNSLGQRAVWVKCDVSAPSDVKKVFNTLTKKIGKIHVLINGAGQSQWRPLEKVDSVFLEKMIAVNLKSVFYTTQAALTHLAKGSSIINIASIAGKRGSMHNSVYCAAKFAVVGLTQSLAKELGPQGIRVNGVCPVYVVTDGLREALKDKWSPAQGKSVDAYLTSFTQTQTALNRLPRAEEVAAICLFLASDESAAITGQNINVDCGVFPQ